MNPLDLLKIKFQVNTGKQAGTIGKQMWLSLKQVQQTQGWKGLYRGIGPNIAGNASSWGLYFLLYVIPKLSVDYGRNSFRNLPSFSLPSIQLQHAQETSFGRRYNETLNRDGISRLLGGSKYAGLTPESERIADASNS